MGGIESALAIEWRGEESGEPGEDGKALPTARRTEDGVGRLLGTLACTETDRSISAARGDVNGL